MTFIVGTGAPEIAPVRIKVIVEDLRVLHRQRDLDLGIVVAILAAYARTSDTEGRVRDASTVYRQIDPAVEVVDEAFRKALIRAAPVLRHLLREWMRELATRAPGALHAIYRVRAQAVVGVEVTAGREHDSPHLDPDWGGGVVSVSNRAPTRRSPPSVENWTAQTQAGGGSAPAWCCDPTAILFVGE